MGESVILFNTLHDEENDMINATYILENQDELYKTCIGDLQSCSSKILNSNLDRSFRS